MKTSVIVSTAMVLFCGVAVLPAQAQDASAGGAGATGAMCSDLNAMDAAGQTAYLQGYQAGRNDAMMGASAGASTDVNSAGVSGDAAAAAGNADTTASGGTSTGVDSAASTGGDAAAGGAMSTDTTAGGAMSTDTTAGGAMSADTTAGGAMSADTGAMASGGGSFDASAIIMACQSNPTGTLSEAMGGTTGSM